MPANPPTVNSTLAETAPQMPRVKTLACLGGISLERGVAMDDVHGYVHDPTNIVWVDIEDPGPEEFSMLLEEFGFHPLAMEDAAKGQQRPKVDEYKGYWFTVVYSAQRHPAAAEFGTSEVAMFIGRNYLVSIHRGRNPAMEDAMARWARGGKMLTEGIGFLTYTVMDAIVDTYFPVIDAVEEDLEGSEMQLFERPQAANVERLLRYRRNLFALRRVLAPLRDVFHVFLRRDQSMFSANTIAYFQNVYDHVLRLLDAVDMQREMLAGVLEAHLAVVSNRLNATMKTLTVITITVAIAGSVFGAWGMNFGNIPLAESEWGFWAVGGGTLGLIAAALLWSWKRGWL
jgi:magnesium transporter